VSRLAEHLGEELAGKARMSKNVLVLLIEGAGKQAMRRARPGRDLDGVPGNGNA